MREESGLENLGELTPAKILAQCALYSNMVAGLLWYIGPIGCVSRVEADILMYIDRAYSGRKIYGVTPDRDIKYEPYYFHHDESRMGLRAGRRYGCDVDEFSPVFKRLLDIERNRKTPTLNIVVLGRTMLHLFAGS